MCLYHSDNCVYNKSNFSEVSSFNVRINLHYDAILSQYRARFTFWLTSHRPERSIRLRARSVRRINNSFWLFCRHERNEQRSSFVSFFSLRSVVHVTFSLERKGKRLVKQCCHWAFIRVPVSCRRAMETFIRFDLEKKSRPIDCYI